MKHPFSKISHKHNALRHRTRVSPRVIFFIDHNHSPPKKGRGADSDGTLFQELLWNDQLLSDPDEYTGTKYVHTKMKVDQVTRGIEPLVTPILSVLKRTHFLQTTEHLTYKEPGHGKTTHSLSKGYKWMVGETNHNYGARVR
jgi:hypothetical protein